MPLGSSWPRNPHKIYLLVICVLGGMIAITIPHQFADSVATTLPLWAYNLWALSLTISAGLALYGSLAGGATGALMERLGLTVLTGVCVVWGLAITLIFTTKGLGTVLFYSGFAAANIARIRVINHDIKFAREAAHKEGEHRDG